MKKIKLLIIEDEVDVLEINQEYFENKGYEVISAITLSKARFLLEEY